MTDDRNSQDHKEGCPATRVHCVQDQGTALIEEMQALRAWVRIFNKRSTTWNGC